MPLRTVPGAINKFLYSGGKYLQTRRMSTYGFSQAFRRLLRIKLNLSQEKRLLSLPFSAWGKHLHRVWFRLWGQGLSCSCKPADALDYMNRL